MAQVRIITDSTADIPFELVKELDISVIPLKVHLENQTYLDSVNLSAQSFYRKLRETKQLPTTSQPSPHDFLDAYESAIKAGAEEILSIHISSALSGTYQSAVLAKDMVRNNSVQLEVMDSKVTSYPMGGAVVAAARVAKQGGSLAECKAVVEEYIQKQAVYFLVDTLEYLQKGGRIGKASAVFGSLLNIKPILSFNDEGMVYPVDRVRGRKKAVQRVFSHMQEKVPPGPVAVTILHADYKEEAVRWMEKVEAMSEYQIKEKIITSVGPVVGSHTGPKTIACLMVPWEGDEK